MPVHYAMQLAVGGTLSGEGAEQHRLSRAIHPRPAGTRQNNIRASNWREYANEYFPVIDATWKEWFPSQRRYYLWEPFGFYGSGLSRRDFFGEEEANSRWQYHLTHNEEGIDPYAEIGRMAGLDGVMMAMHIGAYQPANYHFYEVKYSEDDPLAEGNPTFSSANRCRLKPYDRNLEWLTEQLGDGKDRVTEAILNRLEDLARAGTYITFDALAQSQFTATTKGVAIAYWLQSMTNRPSACEGPADYEQPWLHGMNSMVNQHRNFWRHYRDQLTTDGGQTGFPDPSDAGGDPTDFNRICGDTSRSDNFGLIVYNTDQLMANPGTPGDLSLTSFAGDGPDLRVSYPSGALVDSGYAGKLVYSTDYLTFLAQGLRQIEDYVHADAVLTLNISDKAVLSIMYHGMTWDEFKALAD